MESKDEIVRVQTSILTLQNLFGPGVGCPVESTIFGLLLALLQSGTPSVDPYSVPSFDVTPGVNPTPTGDCDGINGTPIPCSCPPDRTFFVEVCPVLWHQALLFLRCNFY
jgi:hypothetical protein